MMPYRRGVRLARHGWAAAPAGGLDAEPVRRGRSVTIAQWEQALLLRDGRLERVLEPGLYRFWQPGRAVRRVDLRPWVITLPVQEVPTADGAAVKVTVAGHAKVTDPVAFVTAVRDAEQSLYLAVQVALRDVLAGLSVEELLAGRAALGDRLAEQVRDADRLGVVIERLVIKDIMLSGELKKAQAEMLVARAQGAAALERARGETAALRSLANAARLAAGNPALLQLRLIQQLGSSSGNTVVIGTAPLLLAGQAQASEPAEVPAGRADPANPAS